MRDLLNRLRTKVANSIAKAVVQNVKDGERIQLLQLGGLHGGDADECERHQEYGFNSVPLVGAEAVVVFPNGDRGVGLVVAVDDGRHRPKDWKSGEAGLYTKFLNMVRLRDDGTIEAGSAGGAFQSLATKAELDALASAFAAHIHLTTATVGMSPVGVIAPTTTPTPTAVGTVKFKAE